MALELLDQNNLSIFRDHQSYNIGRGGGGTGVLEPPTSCSLLSQFPYLYLLAPIPFSPAGVPCKIGDLKHIFVI